MRLIKRLFPGRCGGLKRYEIANHRQGLGKADPMEIACERKHIALGIRTSVEPAPVVVYYDDDVVVAPEFDCPARALFPVYREALMLKDGCAAHPGRPARVCRPVRCTTLITG